MQFVYTIHTHYESILKKKKYKHFVAFPVDKFFGTGKFEYLLLDVFGMKCGLFKIIYRQWNECAEC